MHPFEGLLGSLARIRDAKTARKSSWDRSGRNADFLFIAPGRTLTLADIKGPGCVTHIWMTPHQMRS